MGRAVVSTARGSRRCRWRSGAYCSGMSGRRNVDCHEQDRRETAITNDIYTKVGRRFLVRAGALEPSASSGSKPAAARTPQSARTPRSTSPRSPRCARRFPDLELVLIESGGDNLAATFSPGARGPHHLRHRCGRRRQNPVEGRTRHHPLRSSGHQQDRSCAPCGCFARGDAARRAGACAASARSCSAICAAAKVLRPSRVHRGKGWPGVVTS